MSYVSEVLADVPGGYWRLAETSGTNATDTSGNANTGTYTNITGYTLNQPSLVPSDADPSVLFIRANSGYVTVPDHATLDLTDTWTLEAWVGLNALGQATAKSILSKQTGAYAYRISDTDKIEVLRSNTALIFESTTALTTIGPHHIVATKSGVTRQIYLNGYPFTTTLNANSTCANNTSALTIGQDVTVNFFDGRIDEVAVYPTALTAARVLAHYKAGIAVGLGPPPPALPVVYLHQNK